MRKYKMLFKIGFLKLSTYIEASLVNTISAILYIIVQFFVWASIAANSQHLEMSFVQIFSYIVYSQMLLYTYPSTIGKQLGQMIKSGEISMSLLRPLSLIKQLVFENIGTSCYKFLFISVPIFCASLLISRFTLCYANILLAIFVFVLSYCIYIYIDMLFGLLQFYTLSSWGINSLKYAIITLCSGRVLPLTIYPKWSKKILLLLPFKYLFDAPLSILMGYNENSIESFILKMIIWLIIMKIGFKILFNKAVKRLNIMGG